MREDGGQATVTDTTNETTFDLKQLLGSEVIDWLTRARTQTADAKWIGGNARKPSDGCWRDAGWLAGVEIVRAEFEREPWVETPVATLIPGVEAIRVDSRWQAKPDEFLIGIEAKLEAARGEWVNRDGANFHGASGALSCCITAVRRLRQVYSCRHDWGRLRSRPYSRDDPPEPDFRRCESCGAEREEEE